MIHARADYNRIQDPAVDDPSLLAPGTTPIGRDEPVFLLRAKDLAAPDTVRQWARAAYRMGASGTLTDLAMRWADRMEEWQESHGCKLPDLPTPQLKVENDR